MNIAICNTTTKTKTPKNTFQFTVKHMHGDADAYTTKTLLEPDAQAAYWLWKILKAGEKNGEIPSKKALKFLDLFVAHTKNPYNDDAKEFVTENGADTFFRESDIYLTDSTCDSYLAKVEEIKVSFFDEQGLPYKVVFDKKPKGYRVIEVAEPE